jgi:hypothetical protein
MMGCAHGEASRAVCSYEDTNSFTSRRKLLYKMATSWDPIGDTSAFPYFHELCEPVRKKYGFPLSYYHNPGADYGGRPKDSVTQEMYLEYWAAQQKAQEWLEATYPAECRDTSSWGRSKPTCVSGSGMSSWVSSEAAPAPHYGSMGSQWNWESSPAGCMGMTTPPLCRAYQNCVQKRKEADAAAEAAKQKKLQLAAAAQRSREAEASRTADMKRVWIQRLCDSLDMHYFPVRVVKGVRRPAEWLPAFNQDVLDRMDRTFEKALANEIYADAFAISKPRADAMLRQRREAEEAAELERERRQARLLAEALMMRQQLAAPRDPIVHEEVAAPVDAEVSEPVVLPELEVSEPVVREEQGVCDRCVD